MRKLSKLAAVMATSAAVPAAMVAVGAVPAHAAASYPAHYAAPYLQVSGSDVGDMQSDKNASGDKYYTLAFLTPRSGCTPEWEDGGDSLNAFVSQVHTLQGQGGNVIISNGGASGGELALTCTNVSSLQAAYQNQINTYGANRLDFDIEPPTSNNSSANTRRNEALAALSKADSSAEIDFTLPVNPSGLDSWAQNMLRDAHSRGVRVKIVNIMVMDFGDGENALSDAESAANATHGEIESIFGVSSTTAWNMLGLTPIAGHNDDNENFTQSNASTLESFAASRGVGELAFWEVQDYDRATGYAYSKIFNKITGGSTSPSPTPTPTPTGGGGSFPTGYHQLVVGNDGLCVDINGNSTSNSAVVDQYTCKSTSNTNQEFKFNSVSGGYGELQNENSGKDIVVQSASTTRGAKIIQYTQNGTTNGLWLPIHLSDGSWQFKNNNSGMCLDVTGAVSTNGVQLEQYTCKSSAAGTNQAFKTK